MGMNTVEINIQDGALHTFKVKAGVNIKIGDLVEISGDYEVQKAGVTSTKVIGIVDSGTVGIDGINVGYSGDQKHVVTVVMLKPQVLIKAGTGGLTAGNIVKSDANGAGVALVQGTDSDLARVGIVLKGATAGNMAVVALG